MDEESDTFARLTAKVEEARENTLRYHRQWSVDAALKRVREALDELDTALAATRDGGK